MQKKFRTAYDRIKTPGLECPEKGRTKQSFKKECDINTILKRMEITGALPEMIKGNPQYGDFSTVQSYQDSLNTVMFANEQFAALPAKVRNRFSNDPASFLAFTQDPANFKELVKMGLATATPVEDKKTGPTPDKGPESPQEARRASKKGGNTPATPPADE